MEATYETLYSDVGRETLETWLRLGVVRWYPLSRLVVRRAVVSYSGSWLVALRACDGIAYIYKVYDSKEHAEAFARSVSTHSKMWRCAEVWHIVEGADFVEHMRRVSDGVLCSIRWVSRDGRINLEIDGLE